MTERTPVRAGLPTLQCPDPLRPSWDDRGIHAMTQLDQDAATRTPLAADYFSSRDAGSSVDGEVVGALVVAGLLLAELHEAVVEQAAGPETE